MKVKKRYLVACILLCVLAVVLSVLMFNFEMGLARYAKLNKVTSETWLVTSGSDLDTRLNSNLFVTKVTKAGEENAGAEGHEANTGNFSYLGPQYNVAGKYIAYEMEKWGNVVVNGGEVKIGDRIEVYYKPDAPLTTYVRTSIMPYIIGILCVVAGAIVIVVLCVVLNKSLKDNTFSDASVTFMNIPMAVVVAGLVLAFFAGMFIGNIQVDASYTVISQGLAEQYAAHELAF